MSCIESQIRKSTYCVFERSFVCNTNVVRTHRIYPVYLLTIGVLEFKESI